MSLMYIKNKIGPKMEPCGTPVVMFSSDDVWSFIVVYCFRFDK